MSDFIKINEYEAVARQHVVRMSWLTAECETLVLILTTGKCNVFGDDARRVWREWIGERDAERDAQAYGDALRTIVHLHEKFGEKTKARLLAGIAEHALGMDRSEPPLVDYLEGPEGWRGCEYLWREGCMHRDHDHQDMRCQYPTGCPRRREYYAKNPMWCRYNTSGHCAMLAGPCTYPQSCPLLPGQSEVQG